MQGFKLPHYLHSNKSELWSLVVRYLSANSAQAV